MGCFASLAKTGTVLVKTEIAVVARSVATKQSIFRPGLGCFASLAKTGRVFAKTGRVFAKTGGDLAV